MFADGLDYLPVSSLAEIAYCPRNFYYRTVEQLDDYNVHTLRGKLQEEKRSRRERLYSLFGQGIWSIILLLP